MKEKIKAKLKSYGFWVSLSSAVMVFLNTLGLKVDIPYLSQVTTAFLSILVIAGILTKPGDSGSGSAEGGAEDTEEETAEENAEETAESRPDGETSESGEAETGAPGTGETAETAHPEPPRTIRLQAQPKRRKKPKAAHRLPAHPKPSKRQRLKAGEAEP